MQLAPHKPFLEEISEIMLSEHVKDIRPNVPMLTLCGKNIGAVMARMQIRFSGFTDILENMNHWTPEQIADKLRREESTL